ncbi:MAG: hypothetical protein H7Y07_13735 [Pyrinomonadaceae bacterium]|nr:hypothetical protein [Sphingobacteriaceae bacterium]
MKKILLMIAFIAGTISFSMAQGGGGTPEERTQRNLDRLKTTLSLNADQEAKIKAIMLSQNKSQDSIRAAAGEGADRAAIFQKLTPVREANDKKIMALLTDDQKKAYTTYLEERRQRMGGQGGGAPRPAGQ